jgi:hypothetical protein
MKDLKLYNDCYKVAFYSLLKEIAKKEKISTSEQAGFVLEALFVGCIQFFFVYGIYKFNLGVI